MGELFNCEGRAGEAQASQMTAQQYKLARRPNPVGSQSIQSFSNSFRSDAFSEQRFDRPICFNHPDLIVVGSQDQAPLPARQEPGQTNPTSFHGDSDLEPPMAQHIPNISGSLAVARDAPCLIDRARSSIVSGEGERDVSEPVEHLP